MPTFKLIVSDPASGKSSVHELKEAQAQMFVGLKIGGLVDATTVGVRGKIRITGGSDRAGFPMRGDVSGGVKKRVLLSSRPGYRPTHKGLQKRKLVRGNTITDETYQINAVLQAAEEKAPPKTSPAT